MQELGRASRSPLVLQFNMVHGRPQEEGPFIQVHTMRDEGSLAHLFVLTEADTEGSEDTCTRVAESLIQHFMDESGSVTGRLQEAVKRTHEGLLSQNFRLPEEERTTVGILCAYLRAPDLYLAYVGPSVAYLMGPHSGRALAPAPGDPAARLGSPRSQQVWTRHHRLLPEETLLLASSALAVKADANLIYGGFRQRLEDGMALVYRLADRSDSFAALAVAPQLQWNDLDAPSTAGVPERPAQRQRQFPVNSNGNGHNGTWDPQPVTERSPLQGRPWEPIPALNLGLPLGTRPGRYPSRYSGQILRPIAAGLAGIFLLGGLVAGTQAIVSSNHQRDVAEASEMVDRAQVLWGEAQSAASKDERRQKLLSANQLVEEAKTRAPASESGADSLSLRLQGALNDLDAIQPLQDVRLVADVQALTGTQVLLRDPVLRDGQLNLLDKLGNQVLEVPMAATQGGGARPVVSTVYQARGTSAPRLTSLVSLGRSGPWPRDSVFAIDESGSLTELTSSGDPREITLRGIQQWQSFQATAAANGAIYVLDPKGSQVVRHGGSPTGTAFDVITLSTPRTLDITDTVDLFVDSEMYILSKAGRVVKLSAGQPQPFPLDGLDQQLSNPLAVASSISSKYLYILDGNNKRIVVVRKQDGAFLRQHPLGELPPLYGLLPDLERGRLLLIGETKVYSALLPAE